MIVRLLLIVGLCLVVVLNDIMLPVLVSVCVIVYHGGVDLVGDGVRVGCGVMSCVVGL